MLKVNDLSHDYKRKGNFVVKDISFEINKGEIFGFLGPSGSGKSTVQNIIIGLIKLQSGSVYYSEVDIRKVKKDFYNKIGVSFEQPNLYPNLTGEENLKYFAGLFTVPTISPIEILNKVGLEDSIKKKTREYSKGMKQRLVFARSLLNNPTYLFLDEPTAGLDPSLSLRISELILEEKDKGKVIFLTTHNMELADKICDRVAFLESGKIRALDTPYNLKLQYGKRVAKISYHNKGKEEEIYDLDKERQKLSKVILNENIDTIHTGEATLEDIFIKITGRGLL